MKYLSFLLLSVILLTSCSSPTSCEQDVEAFPKLKVTNAISCNDINTVSLLGYNFENLAIAENESKTFTLSNGMPAGLEDVNIDVSGFNQARGKGFGGSISVNFAHGQTTSIKLVISPTATFCNQDDIYVELDE